jgi:hypothetical protein
VSSDHLPPTFEYTYTLRQRELEEAFGGSAGGRIPRPRTLYWFIEEGREEGGGRGKGLISKELSILRLCCHAHTSLTTIGKGLGELLLDLSRLLLTHVKLPGTY